MDICMCTGNCAISNKCLRYIKKPNRNGQTYTNLEEVCISDNYSEFIPYEEYFYKEEKENKISYTLDDFIMDEIRKQRD